MRIHRSLTVTIQQLTATTLRKVALGSTGTAVIALAVLFGQNILHSPLLAHADTPPESCFAYTTTSNQVTITNYYNNEGNNSANPACTLNVDIPATLGGNPVVAIGPGSYPGPFQGKNLTAVTIPSSVTTIGNYAFYRNKLTSVIIPNSVTTIGVSSFFINQLTSVTIPNSVTTIGDQAFYGNQLTSVTIPNSVTSIGDFVFAGNQLTSVTIPNSVTMIGSSALQDNQLTSVTIPNSVTSIGDNAFYGNQLTNITISGNPTTLGSNILKGNPVSSISYNGTTYTENPTISDQCYGFSAGNITSYKLYDLNLIKTSGIACVKHDIAIPSTIGGVAVTMIGSSALQNNQLTSVTIPNSVTMIGSGALQNNQLTSVTIPNSVTSIGDFVFAGNQLTSVTIPSSVTSIGNQAFQFNQLTSVTIPNSVTTIGASAFSYNQLTSVTIPGSVSTIGDYAFFSNSLTEATIPNTVTSIAPFTFAEQNPWGRSIEDNVPGIPYIYSTDPTVVQQAYDSIWYVKLYTANPTNPNHIKDGLMSEWYWNSDANKNGIQTDSYGGHIVNPANTTVNTLDRDGNTIGTTTVTGTRSSDGTPLTNYLATPAGTFAPLDPTAPTPTEQTTMDAGFAQYNRIGQTKIFTAPVIPGYTLLSPPSPTSVTLTSANTAVNFTYAKSLSTVNFATPVGSATNPTPGAVPAGLSTVLSNSIFQVVTSQACSVINSAKLLPASNFTPPSSSDTTVGGLDFTLDCSQPGKDATVSLTLGKALSDTSLVKVYKKTTSGTVTDITSLVTITNQATPNGTKTVISYNLVDGGALDDDGVANGSISDPIYVVVSSSMAGELANTGENVFVYAGVGAMLVLLAAGGLVVGVRGVRRER